MNALTTKLTDAFSATAALIVYKSKESKNYIEIRPIKNGCFGSAKPVSIDFMTSLCESFSETYSQTPSGILPENMLYCDTRKGKEIYVWSNPPMKRRMYFTKSLNIKNAEYHVPGVIYVVKDGDLDIYAYKGKNLTAKAKIFKAPFFNVTNESVCLGDSDIELGDSPTFDDLLKHWEKEFWQTEFSHLGGNVNPTKDNLVNVTKSAKNKPFDEAQLLPFEKLNLEELLNDLE